MKFGTDTNHVIENLFTTQHENNIEVAHDDAMLDSWFDAQTYTEQLIDNSRNHNCLNDVQCWNQDIDIDDVPMNVTCKLEPINEII